LIFRQTTIRDIAVATPTSFYRMNEFLNEHTIRPVIDKTIHSKTPHRAFEHQARGGFDKGVINVS
jgi:NADPH:quinone reductase-like Zn-dependent oxidoreductase